MFLIRFPKHSKVQNINIERLQTHAEVGRRPRVGAQALLCVVTHVLLVSRSISCGMCNVYTCSLSYVSALSDLRSYWRLVVNDPGNNNWFSTSFLLPALGILVLMLPHHLLCDMRQLVFVVCSLCLCVCVVFVFTGFSTCSSVVSQHLV